MAVLKKNEDCPTFLVGKEYDCLWLSFFFHATHGDENFFLFILEHSTTNYHQTPRKQTNYNQTDQWIPETMPFP